jgi:hypothetical protein
MLRGGHCVKKKAKKNEIRAAERQEEKNKDATAKTENRRARRKTGRQGCPNSKQQAEYAIAACQVVAAPCP